MCVSIRERRARDRYCFLCCHLKSQLQSSRLLNLNNCRANSFGPNSYLPTHVYVRNAFRNNIIFFALLGWDGMRCTYVCMYRDDWDVILYCVRTCAPSVRILAPQLPPQAPLMAGRRHCRAAHSRNCDHYFCSATYFALLLQTHQPTHPQNHHKHLK